MIDATESTIRKSNCYNVNDNELSVPGPTGFDNTRRLLHEQRTSPVLNVATGVNNHDKISRAFLASSIASIASVLFGYTLGFTSPTQADIEKEMLTADQFSWFAIFYVIIKRKPVVRDLLRPVNQSSDKTNFILVRAEALKVRKQTRSLVAIGAVFGCLIGAILIDKFGRKTAIMLISLVHTPGWCLICYGHSVELLCIGRFLTGLGVGIGSLAVPMYIGEVASARLRGGLGSINQLSITFGIFFVYIIGFCLSWRWTAILPVLICALMVLLMTFMPESPRWLLANNKRHKALLALAWLRGPDYDAEEECFEIESNLDQQNKISIRDFKNRSLYKPFIICAFLMVFQQMTGINAIILYCTKIFDLAGLHDPKLSSLAVAGTQILFTGFACLIVDKTGRKILLLIGGVVMFLCQFFLGVYFDLIEVDNENRISIFGKYSHKYDSRGISILAVLCIAVYIAIFSFGWGPLPWLLMSELFPPRAKGVAGGIVVCLNWCFVFLITNLFHHLISTLYVQGTFWLFGGFALLSFLFTLVYVPETKGKTLEEIQELFAEQVN